MFDALVRLSGAWMGLDYILLRTWIRIQVILSLLIFGHEPQQVSVLVITVWIFESDVLVPLVDEMDSLLILHRH